MAFGAGWATAQDRQLIIELLRGPGRLAALDAPGISAFAAGALRQDLRAEHADRDLSRAAVRPDSRRSGPAEQRVVRIVDAYVAGINGWYAKAGLPLRPVDAAGRRRGRRTDRRRSSGRVAETRPRRTNFLALLQERLGAERGRQVWEDLRLRDDPEARAAVDGTFPYGDADPYRARQRRDRPAHPSTSSGPTRATLDAHGDLLGCEDVERAARRGEALGDRQAAARRGPAGRATTTPGS